MIYMLKNSLSSFFTQEPCIQPKGIARRRSVTLLEQKRFLLKRDWMISSEPIFISTSTTYGNINTIGLINLKTIILDAACKI